MASVSCDSLKTSVKLNKCTLSMDAISKLYPAINEGDTALPRSWSTKDKLNFLGLSNNNLRVHYKGMIYLVQFLYMQFILCVINLISRKSYERYFKR